MRSTVIAGRDMAMDFKGIDIPNKEALERRYGAQRVQYERILNELQRGMKALLSQTFSHPTIKVRVKHFTSYYQKILKRLQCCQTKDNAFDITDVLGMRIILPFLEDLKTVEALIREKFQVIEMERKGANYSFKEFGYDSIHFLIKVPAEILSLFQFGSDLVCEVQLRTILQDAWAEIEHELVYKAEFAPFDEPLKRKLAALNANLTLSDIIFQEIRDYQQQLHAQLKRRRATFHEKIRMAASQINPEMAENYPSKKEAEEDVERGEEITTGSSPHKKRGHHGNLDDLLLDALEAHNSKQFKEAIAIYTAILGLKPLIHIQSLIHIHRGMAYTAESDYKQALEDFSRALELDQKSAKAYYYRGVVYSILTKYSEALEDFHQCLRLNPYQYDPIFCRAQIYFHLGDYSQALIDCEQALNLQPESEQAHQFKQLVQARLHL